MSHWQLLRLLVKSSIGGGLRKFFCQLRTTKMFSWMIFSRTSSRFMFGRKKDEGFQDLCQENMIVNQYVVQFVQLPHFTPIMVATESRKA